ncbi:hypothetical protein J2Y54_003084 [Sphingomonas sp. BE123]|uniref:hypothetical protein n=1 Tax=Sphingomonas sp. BE123 TaxID=2817842 RepID=UPI0028634B2F|nr:hypothetical protein [Sphingomonas sp. BE123]MDR6853564.1 hypothetical protein [Sphingomonas sp. BE123]
MGKLASLLFGLTSMFVGASPVSAQEQGVVPASVAGKAFACYFRPLKPGKIDDLMAQEGQLLGFVLSLDGGKMSVVFHDPHGIAESLPFERAISPTSDGGTIVLLGKNDASGLLISVDKPNQAMAGGAGATIFRRSKSDAAIQARNEWFGSCGSQAGNAAAALQALKTLPEKTKGRSSQ